MRDSYMKMAMQVSEMSTMLTMQRNLDGLLVEAGRRLAEMKLTQQDLNWIKETQGNHGKAILKILKSERRSRSD